MIRRDDVWLAAGVVALGLVLLFGVTQISPGAGYDRIGPRLFPTVVAAGLILLGIALAIPSLRRRSEAEPAESSLGTLDRVPLAYLALALLLFLALVERAGFICTASLQFWLVARAFRSRRPARDAVAAVVMSLIVYLVFSNGLGLPLPAGIVERWL